MRWSRPSAASCSDDVRPAQPAVNVHFWPPPLLAQCSTSAPVVVAPDTTSATYPKADVAALEAERRLLPRQVYGPQGVLLGATPALASS